ncbi:MAG TPA: peptidylprolyl isomerase [Bacteroidota bacterium]|nr:peptidylprolyl isomerase [Bacteroidota bacterium]
MKKIRSAILLLMAGWAFWCNTARAQTVIDRIAAVVDKEIITESELSERVAFYAYQNKLDPATPGLKHQMLESMISEKLVLAQAIIDSVQVTDDDVTQALDQQLQRLVRQFGSEKGVEDAYGKPISRIKRDYRDEMRKQLLVQKIQQTRQSSVQVTANDVAEFYNTYKDSLTEIPETYTISHIYLIPKPDTTVDRQTYLNAKVILDSLRAGGDFADFARRYSADATAKNGGDLGWSKRGDFVPEFEEALFSLKEGQISDVVKTQYGYHIIQLIARRGESVHARHILFRVEKSAASDSAAVAQLRELKARALKGESFAELAKKYSEDEQTKPLGGDLGDITAKDITPDFAEEIKGLKEGDISEPTRITVGNSYGYQIVLMRKRVPAHMPTLEGDYHQLERLALYVKQNRLYNDWLNELKKNIYLDVRL